MKVSIIKRQLITNLLIISLVIVPNFLSGQNDSLKTHRFGVIGVLDYAYNFPDKVLTGGLFRKWTLGLSLTNKKRQFIVIIGAGMKGFKYNIYSPTFRESFLQDVQQHFVPIKGQSEDSVIAGLMGGKSILRLSGTYAYQGHLGFILNNKFKPSLDFYYGSEDFLLHGSGIAHYEDPENGDIDYVSLTRIFYEIKLGILIPPYDKAATKFPLSANLKVGYEWVDYGSLKFHNTPLSAYTTGSLEKKYQKNGKFTISLSFSIWSNWKS